MLAYQPVCFPVPYRAVVDRAICMRGSYLRIASHGLRTISSQLYRRERELVRLDAVCAEYRSVSLLRSGKNSACCISV